MSDDAGPRADPDAWDAGQAGSSAADAPGTARKRKAPASAAEVCEATVDNPSPGIMQPPSLSRSSLEPAPSASASRPVLHCGAGLLVEPQMRAASSAAPVTTSRKRRKKNAIWAAMAAEACEATATANSASASASASGDGGHSCSSCEEHFPTLGALAIHERAHAGKKPYACSMCPRRFAEKSKVAPHERTRTGEKPYACSMCPMRFAHKSAVPKHERTHTGEKPYACSMCPRRFCNKSDVTRHDRTHTGE